jgi:hypothetical protein
MVSLSADHTEQKYTYADLVELYVHATTSFYVFVVCFFFLLTLSLWVYHFRHTYRAVALGSASGLLIGCQFLMKSTSEIIGNDPACFASSIGPYFIILGAISLLGGGFALLNFGLKRYEAVLLTPIFQSTVCIAGSLSGMAYFNEAADMEPWQFGVYFAGLILVLVGVWVMFKERLVADALPRGVENERMKRMDDFEMKGDIAMTAINCGADNI